MTDEKDTPAVKDGALVSEGATLYALLSDWYGIAIDNRRQLGIDAEVLKAIDAEVKAIVADAAEFARTSPEPEPLELYTDVYLEAAE